MVDTGIRLTHEDFGYMDGTPGSRAVAGFSVFGDNNSSDCYGHGTHTAATVGGQHFRGLLKVKAPQQASVQAAAEKGLKWG